MKTVPLAVPTGRVAMDAASTTSWLSNHSEALIYKPATIAGIIIVALVVRAFTVRLIHRVVRKMTERSPGTIGAMLESQLWLAGERRRQRAQTMGSVLRSIASVVILTVAVLTIIGELNIDLRPLLAGASIVGVAVAFGAQSLVTDFLSGVFMILEDQYGVGDVIDAGTDITGTVEAVGLRVTRIRDVDGVTWYLRNGEVKRIGNKSQGFGRAVVDVPVEADQDQDRVREVIRDTAEEMANDPMWEEVMLEPAMVAGLEFLAADGVVIRVTVKTQPTKHVSVAQELRARIKLALDEAGIKLSPLPDATKK